jgi:hypothetical protein
MSKGKSTELDCRMVKWKKATSCHKWRGFRMGGCIKWSASGVYFGTATLFSIYK